MSGNWYWDMQADLRLLELWRTKNIRPESIRGNTDSVSRLVRLHLLRRIQNGD
jgi:hypothetical protein